MDPLFRAYGSVAYGRRDDTIRLAREEDIPAVGELFRQNYGNSYPFPDVYDGTWVKRSIHSDKIFCLVLVQDGRVLATGSVMLDHGGPVDKAGEMARLVVHPDFKHTGLGRRVLNALFQVAENTLEFAVGEARTAHAITQELLEHASFTLVGFVPAYHIVNGRREGQVLYAKLHGNGQYLRSETPPRVIPEAAALASFVLRGMGLPDNATVEDDDAPPRVNGAITVRPLDRESVGPLMKIPHGRLVDPLLFGKVSLAEGFSQVRGKANYLVAFDEKQTPVGTIGYSLDEASRLVIGQELIGRDESVWLALCEAMLRACEEARAQLVELNVSAYAPRLQRLLHGFGFRPAAYAPAMVFRGTERLDVLKMVKLNTRYAPRMMVLTDAASAMCSLVEPSFGV
jgi:RimJ/RimL family protein N-acetyltransferase